MSSPKLYVKVCVKCGRQVSPHVDHNLGTGPWVYCSHGRVGPPESVRWKRIEVVPKAPEESDGAD